MNVYNITQDKHNLKTQIATPNSNLSLHLLPSIPFSFQNLPLLYLHNFILCFIKVILSSLNFKIKINSYMLSGHEFSPPKKLVQMSEAFSHTTKLSNNPFHNRCEITLTISPSHIEPWVKCRDNMFLYILLVNLGFDSDVEWSCVLFFYHLYHVFHSNF